MILDTIVSIITPIGKGAVGIIRLSGDASYSIALKISNNESLIPRKCYFSLFTNRDKKILDKGLVIYFKAPKSFTGEDIIEFHLHGSPIILDILLEECIYYGARLALPGEFSKRAFINGKIDLTQAEAISDIIQSTSRISLNMSMRLLYGNFGKMIKFLNKKIVNLRVSIEAFIDFSEEVFNLNQKKILNKINNILFLFKEIKKNTIQEKKYIEGLKIVILGNTNVGKSTLINTLSNKQISMVTDIPGTTRDLIKVDIFLDNFLLHLVDTAGIRRESGIIEREGIKLAKREAFYADCIFFVIDSMESLQKIKSNKMLNRFLLKKIPILIVFNKIDILNISPKRCSNIIYISAKKKIGIDLIRDFIKELFFKNIQLIDEKILIKKRHKNALDKAYSFLLFSKKKIISCQLDELLAEDLKLAHKYLGEITGEFTSDDLLEEIFSNFCIGK
ncbi:tRNA uridine-5-carboxymethylaminomethyl(34) synthesis GTPase MnmE [Candidatus Legionella polyplacis]|uniref:tRNA uridine-5-carboxymethylaminomethyl(34) synthesis GTPase MnmE n=1 Tax=Candidatus Legionella polyplacis TaxID=2005262 RepID=UPI000C1E0F49|nr:tRNA uridine-5-carboxymethylaminomethyl(34) synthesis GTPase MnmE [Candidatus Legionella polyplacis]ATW01897.1 tRNA uridine-5-carboxymethylaminomethyl(34) synthesis GTPase MnmE [Candidatus Legionella polyplacis]